ncbi:hypothetical protein M011DRAFT_414010 [Sporormia fimetaria CBS 119925]|uniref:Rhodopsin domain-containing protein n=1 Tax=Sporormia fimetaria CBS 119925 TaxID=1340428 RepID=A0A6A6UWA7_9PLEO|nr:hypothetical protein M011DRAFT_414010 [Sporormia fimetaria CBS 119925]
MFLTTRQFLSGLNPSLIPAGLAPKGADPRIGGGPSLGVFTIVLESILISVAVVAVTMRTISAWIKRDNSSDGLTTSTGASLFALVLAIGQSAIVMSTHEYLRHQWNVSVAMLTTNYLKRTFAGNIITWPSIFLAKISILWLYLHIFQVKKSMRYAVYAGAVWAAFTYFPNVVVAGYWCSAHVGEPWGLNVGLRCSGLHPSRVLIATATMSIILDIYIFVLPIPVVLGLNLSRPMKFGIPLVFAAAFFAIIAAVLNLVYRVKLHVSDKNDLLWLSAQLFICNAVENYVSIIVGALPGCSAFFKTFIRNPAVPKSLSANSSASRSRKNRKEELSSQGTHDLELQDFILNPEMQHSFRAQDNMDRRSSEQLSTISAKGNEPMTRDHTTRRILL